MNIIYERVRFNYHNQHGGEQYIMELYRLASFPGAFEKSEKSAWYPLFVQVLLISA